jgi:hypothetical protein
MSFEKISKRHFGDMRLLDLTDKEVIEVKWNSICMQ